MKIENINAREKKKKPDSDGIKSLPELSHSDG